VKTVEHIIQEHCHIVSLFSKSRPRSVSGWEHNSSRIHNISNIYYNITRQLAPTTDVFTARCTIVRSSLVIPRRLSVSLTCNLILALFYLQISASNTTHESLTSLINTIIIRSDVYQPW